MVEGGRNVVPDGEEIGAANKSAFLVCTNIIAIGPDKSVVPALVAAGEFGEDAGGRVAEVVQTTLPVDVEPRRGAWELRGLRCGGIHGSKEGFTVHVQEEGVVRRPRPKVAN